MRHHTPSTRHRLTPPGWNTRSSLHGRDICRFSVIGRRRVQALSRYESIDASRVSRRCTYGHGWDAGAAPGRGGAHVGARMPRRY